MKMTLALVLALLCAAACIAQKKTLTGVVTAAADAVPLAGVNVVLKGTAQGTTTDTDGRFTIEVTAKQALVFSFIGYLQQEATIADDQEELYIRLTEDIATLGEVVIVSTGYQQLPKERATGSFVQLDQQLINRRVGTDILSRLEDITSGLIFNRNVPGKKNDISIRGLSTINSATQPLLIVDNFPYEGDMNTINPNDVESITVLKDAAAASIWGARAGNGVIVITTKKGSYEQPLKVTFNSNTTFIKKPDLFYNPLMSPAEVIENEKRLFDRGYYNERELSYSGALTPAVELMIARRDGKLTAAAYQEGITALAGHDVRSDYEDYLNRTAVNQQYALSLNGGTKTHRYFFSAGWDKNQDNLVGNQYDRVTLNMSNTWSLLNDRLKVSPAIYYSLNQSQINSIGYTAKYAYARLRDEEGNNLPITMDHRLSFIDQAQQQGLLSWKYVPLDELKLQDNTQTLTDYRINTTANYRIMKGLNAEVLYQYWNGNTQQSNLHDEASYFARDIINTFSKVTSGVVTRPVPLGGILDQRTSVAQSQSARIQLIFSRELGHHSLHALAGYEVREQNTETSLARSYGHNSELATSRPVDYITFFEQYDFQGRYQRIYYVDYQSSYTDRYISHYGNVSYVYKNRYTVSGSARVDKSNLFGVRANQRAVPLWSAGTNWNISDESFYKLAGLSLLKARVTYGVNGNINKSMTAFTTAYAIGDDTNSGQPYAVIGNAANPDLRWEKVKVTNVGVDFELKHRRLSGSIEYFNKQGVDLIGTRVFPSAMGVGQFTGNFASSRTYGADLVLNSINIDKAFRWSTTLLLSTNREKVTRYEIEPAIYDLLDNGTGSSGTVAPLKGHPLLSVYSYRWAGLDPETGDPRGYLNGVPSSNANAVVAATTPQDLIYHGAARPTTYGSLRNTLSWNNLSLSCNITARLGYYTRQNTIAYSQLLQGNRGHADYGARWQKPGDEAFTNVPSIPAVSGLINRDALYMNSEVLVERGDHIRLQDIQLTYTISQATFTRLPVSRMELYSYINNVGMIWKKMPGPIDPDYPTVKPLRSIAFGLRVDF